MNKSYLSDKIILDYYKKGEIVIEPFNMKNLNTGSYDVTLGEWFFREQIPQDQWIFPKYDRIPVIYNLYSKEMVKSVWGEPQKAIPYSDYKQKGIILENIQPEDLIIFINPGETILAHTNEFIGGVNHINTMMKARSSMGRNFIKTCSCAGLGDIGYFNRWTMEITNSSTIYKIPLIVGRRLAQIVFFDTDEILKDRYNKNGKYQNKNTLEELKKTWSPYDMLPKLYNDFELKN